MNGFATSLEKSSFALGFTFGAAMRGRNVNVVEHMGDGPKPAPNDTVSVHYRGVMIDGSVFDSTYNRG